MSVVLLPLTSVDNDNDGDALIVLWVREIRFEYWKFHCLYSLVHSTAKALEMNENYLELLNQIIKVYQQVICKMSLEMNENYLELLN